MNNAATNSPSEPNELPRRRFLAASVAATAAGAFSAHARSAPSLARPQRATAPCRNVIFMVSDGMSMGTLTLADTWLRRKRERPSHWVALWSRPHVRRASASTHSADSVVTDSAAGASAWGIGLKTNNEVLNVTTDGHAHTPILVHARENGKATGVVTTARVTHATPAGFYATMPKRSMEGPIGVQLLERSIDIALGGGAKYFPEKFLAGRNGLTVARNRTELLALSRPAGPVLGIFADDHMSYVLDSPKDEPTLAEMTRSAISLLADRPEGFVLQVEGGRVDHAAHNSDAGSLLAEQLAFDDAIAEVVKFTDGRDDTLVVITSDHGNANPGLTYYGPTTDEKLGRLATVKASFDTMTARMKKGDSPVRLGEIIEEGTGIKPKPADLELLARRREGGDVCCGTLWDTPTMLMGAMLSDALGVAFLSPNHTSDFVEVTAFGPGSERLDPMIDNTALWQLMVGAMKLAPAKPIS